MLNNPKSWCTVMQTSWTNCYGWFVFWNWREIQFLKSKWRILFSGKVYFFCVCVLSSGVLLFFLFLFFFLKDMNKESHAKTKNFLDLKRISNLKTKKPRHPPLSFFHAFFSLPFNLSALSWMFWPMDFLAPYSLHCARIGKDEICKK